MIVMNRGLLCALAGADGAKAQRIHYRQRTRAHGEDVAQDSADAGGRSLEGLNERGVIVRFDFKGAGPPIPDVDNAGVLTRSLYHPRAARWQTLEMNARGLVRAMLAPHHAENA